MKIFTALLLLTSAAAFSQDYGNEPPGRKDISDRRHEVKIGAIKLLGGTILEGTYEYVNNPDFTFGGSILSNLDHSNDYFEDFSITPFARFYFQESREYGAKGFFVEGFGKYSSGRDTFEMDGEDKSYSAASLGLSLGKKWVNRTGFVFEILVGFGRTLGNSDHMPPAVFRGDLNIGYRF